jgi:phospholipid/cholesterol/gamma-HCH transport system substrate-binding protein
METSARYLWVGLFVLAAIFAGFGFVYWLNNEGGIGKRAYYKIRFPDAVSGLQIGAAVQFNGMRNGEVTNLRLDSNDPTGVIATIAVAQDTPLRADTQVGVDFQGLMGTPVISLRGGSATLPLLSGSETNPPLLTAEPDAGQDLTQAARRALQHVDKILGDNSDSLKSTLDNFKIFSDALARNSGHIDGLVAALEKFAGGGAEEKPKPVYDLTLSLAGKGAMPQKLPPVQIAINEPTALVTLQTQRLLTRSKDGQIAPFSDAQWADSLPKLLQEKIVQAYENEGYLASIPPASDQAKFDYQLLIDLRNFAIVTYQEPMADLEFAVKIMAADGHIVGTQIFHATGALRASDGPSAVAAFNEAFNKAASELISWTTKVITS